MRADIALEQAAREYAVASAAAAKANAAVGAADRALHQALEAHRAAADRRQMALEQLLAVATGLDDERLASPASEEPIT